MSPFDMDPLWAFSIVLEENTLILDEVEDRVPREYHPSAPIYAKHNLLPVGPCWIVYKLSCSSPYKHV